MASAYRRLHKLGEGGFGTVFLVEEKRTGARFVLKEVRCPSASAQREALKEVAFLKQLRHPNIISYHDYFEESTTVVKGGRRQSVPVLCLVMAHADGGDLEGQVKRRQQKGGKPFSEKQVLEWLTQLCLALQHVHDRKILHRDIKTQNIFLMGNHTVKLGDFGVARSLDFTMQQARTQIGTPYYLSPEICQGRAYDSKSDVWAVGVVLYELMTLRHPFEGRSIKQLMDRIVRERPRAPPRAFSSDLRKLLRAMLHKDPARRPSVADILRQPIVRSGIKEFLSSHRMEEHFSRSVLATDPAAGAPEVAAKVPAPAAPGADTLEGGLADLEEARRELDRLKRRKDRDAAAAAAAAAAAGAASDARRRRRDAEAARARAKAKDRQEALRAERAKKERAAEAKRAAAERARADAEARRREFQRMREEARVNKLRAQKANEPSPDVIFFGADPNDDRSVARHAPPPRQQGNQQQQQQQQPGPTPGADTAADTPPSQPKPPKGGRAPRETREPSDDRDARMAIYNANRAAAAANRRRAKEAERGHVVAAESPAADAGRREPTVAQLVERGRSKRERADARIAELAELRKAYVRERLEMERRARERDAAERAGSLYDGGCGDASRADESDNATGAANAAREHVPAPAPDAHKAEDPVQESGSSTKNDAEDFVAMMSSLRKLISELDGSADVKEPLFALQVSDSEEEEEEEEEEQQQQQQQQQEEEKEEEGHERTGEGQQPRAGRVEGESGGEPSSAPQEEDADADAGADAASLDTTGSVHDFVVHSSAALEGEQAADDSDAYKVEALRSALGNLVGDDALLSAVRAVRTAEDGDGSALEAARGALPKEHTGVGALVVRLVEAENAMYT